MRDHDRVVAGAACIIWGGRSQALTSSGSTKRSGIVASAQGSSPKPNTQRGDATGWPWTSPTTS